MKNDWVETTLGEVFFTTSGGTPSRKNKAFYEGSIPWVKSGELDKGLILDTEEKITEEAIQNSSAKKFPAGTLLIALYGATIGKTAFLGVEAATNQAICGIFKSTHFDSKFLHTYLQFKKPDFISQGSGGAQPNISQTILKKLKIPLAPLPEQRAIVAKIEGLFSELDQGVADLKAAQSQLKIYRQAVLKKAFEGELTKEWREKQTNLPSADELLKQIKEERQKHYDQQMEEWKAAVLAWEENGKEGKKPARPQKVKELAKTDESLHQLPRAWEWCKLGNITQKISDGPFGSNLKTSDYVNSGVRVIRLENIGNLEFNDSKKSFITQQKYESIKKHSVYANDIIFASFIAETTSVASIPEHIDLAINKADCFCVRFGELVFYRYFEYFLSTRSTYTQLVNQVHGATRPRINTTQLKEVIVPLCSLSEQKQIVKEIEARLSVCDELERSLADGLEKAAALRQSILKKAFAGELLSAAEREACRAAADYEPAAQLLERIKNDKF